MFPFSKRSERAPRKPRLAIWFRYGPAEHVRLFHAFPQLVELLSRRYEVHYWGMRSREHAEIPASVAARAKIHLLPFSISRADGRDKTFKTLLWMFLLPLVAVLSLFRGIRYVYIEETIPLGLPVARLFFGKRATMSVADLFLEQHMGGGRVKNALRKMLQAIDARAWRKAPFVVARSAAAPAFLAARFGLDARNVFYAHDAVDFALYAPARSPESREECRCRHDWSSSDFVLVFHGLLNTAKDLDTPLEALPRALERFPGLRLVLLGNGPEEERLRRKVAALGLERAVEFHGYTPGETVAEILSAADAGLVTRRPDDASHLVVTSVLGHCLAAGLPVLATRTAGIAQLVADGENALLFEPGDPDGFLAALLRLLSDPGLRERLARNGRELALSALSAEETAARNAEPFLTRWP